MATLSAAACTAACDAIVNLLDGGSGTDPVVFFGTSGNVEVAKCAMGHTAAFGAATSAAPSVATAAAIDDDTDANGGIIATSHVTLKNRSGAVIITCTIGTTSSTDFQIASLTIGAGDTVGVSSLTVTQPAS